MELVDAKGAPVAFGRTGEPLTFRLHYAAYERLENVVIGIGLDHQNGQHITGTNTRRHGRLIPVLEGDGYVDYAIPTLSLLEGTYELTAAIQDWTEAHDFDHWRHGLKFDVLPSTVHEEGYVSLAGQWQLEGSRPNIRSRRVDAR
jgi:lipopolysaccharide transport system ATP-binding protein